jgi:hypothetical protein
VKLQRWYAGVGDDYGRPGLPMLAVAGAGLVLIARRRGHEGFGLVLAAWALAWTMLTGLGMFTALTLRANLAAAPAFTGLAALALGTLAARSRVGATMAVLLAGVLAWDGLRVAVGAIGWPSRW